MVTRVRLGLVGIGNQGEEYLRAQQYCELAEIVTGFDVSVRERIRSEYGAIELVGCLEELRSQNLDGLILALPHDCYSELWSDLLAFRCPMLKEKPLGRNIKEAWHFVNTARENGCAIQTAIQRRQHPSYVCLAEALKGQAILEVRAHLHLGFAVGADSSYSWRSDRTKAGGGALLDSGYHLVDLVHYLIGQFELINACLWDGDSLIQAESEQVESEAILLGRQGSIWVKVESNVSGEKDVNSKTGFKKSEGVEVLTREHFYSANREGVFRDGVCIFECQKDWEKAIATQMDEFSKHIQRNSWNNRLIWEQLPAMQVIEKAYNLVFTV